jgi:hypothetical protein
VPESFWGFTIESGGMERRVKISTSGLSPGSRLEASLLYHLQGTLGARETNSGEFRPTDILRIVATFADAPGGACPASVAEVAAITWQPETVPGSEGRGAIQAPRTSKGTACFGNDAEDTEMKALGYALTDLNRDSILSLFKELQ